MTHRKVKRKPSIWLLTLRKSLPFKSQPSNASDGLEGSSSIGCLSNLREAIHGSIRHKEKALTCSSKVVGSPTTKYPKTNIIGNEIVLRNLGPSSKGNSNNTGRTAKGVVGAERLICEHSREFYGGSPVLCQICGERHKQRSINASGSRRLSKEYAGIFIYITYHYVCTKIEFYSSKNVSVFSETKSQAKEKNAKLLLFLNLLSFLNIYVF